MRSWRRVGLLALSLLTAAGCAGDGTPRALPTVTVTATPPSPPVALALPSPTRQPKPVTFAFGGDVNFEGPLESRVRNDPASIFAEVAPALRRADIAMVNLETAITERGRAEDKAYTFRAPRSAFTALRAGGVDVVTLANNHGVDYGRVGLLDTLDAARAARFPMVGAGRSAAEAWAGWRTTVRGTRVTVLGATHVLDSKLQRTWTATERSPGLASAYDTDQLLRRVRSARRTSDIVVVYLHWGSERVACPTVRQRALAATLVAEGVDVVVGAHAHVLLGAGEMARSYVAYGLGNFVFGSAARVSAQTGVLALTVTPGSGTTAEQFTPAVISRGVPYLLRGQAARRAREVWASRRACAGLAA